MRKLLALVNPAAGDGLAEEVLSRVTAEVFGPAGVELDRLVTHHLGHARDHVRELGDALFEYEGLLVR